MAVIKLRKNFNIEVNGLSKSFRSTSQEIVADNGYTDIVYRLKATSKLVTDKGAMAISAEVRLLDGIVYDVRFYKYADGALMFDTNNELHQTFESIVDDLYELQNSWYGIQDVKFAESLLGVVLSIQSYDSQTKLYNNEVYDLADIA